MFYQDEQCASNRTGILCGACQPGLSLMLGTSKCSLCSYLYLLLFFAFALAGLLLVLLLVACNLTVTEGTLNGLIFYANIIQINHAAFFPVMHIPILTETVTIFIAWLNLYRSGNRDLLLQWHGSLCKDLAAVCLSQLHLADSWSDHFPQSKVHSSDKADGQECS